MLGSLSVSAQEERPRPCPASPPQFEQLRYEEDYRYLKDPGCRDDLTDALRHVSIGKRPLWFVTFGGEVRQQFEYFGTSLNGSTAPGGYSLQRYAMHVKAQFGDRVRAFGQAKSAVEMGRTGGPRPIDENGVDVHQAFAEVDSGREPRKWTLRMGRQEMAFGSQRLISYQEGTNVRFVFDGIRFTTRARSWQIDAIAMRPVLVKRGAFDDSSDGSRALWGGYATHRSPLPAQAGIDLYYIGVRRSRARFDQGLAREVRHSFGTRLWGRSAAVDYNAEIVAQLGTFGNGKVRAWGVSSDTGYTLERVRFRPRLGLKVNAYSGDQHRTDEDLQTYTSLFPTGAYFGFDGLYGAYNLYDIHPSVRLHLQRNVSIVAENDFFWRQQLDDGLYSNGGGLERSGRGSPDRYIGSKHQLWGQWQANRFTYFVVNYSYFRHGYFLRRSQPEVTDWHYVTAWITYKF